MEKPRGLIFQNVGFKIIKNVLWKIKGSRRTRIDFDWPTESATLPK